MTKTQEINEFWEFVRARTGKLPSQRPPYFDYLTYLYHFQEHVALGKPVTKVTTKGK